MEGIVIKQTRREELPVHEMKIKFDHPDSFLWGCAVPCFLGGPIKSI
jgi:hypothetical protein